VDTTELVLRVVNGTEVLEWRLNPVQTGEITARQHVDEGSVGVHDVMLVCRHNKCKKQSL